MRTPTLRVITWLIDGVILTATIFLLSRWYPLQRENSALVHATAADFSFAVGQRLDLDRVEWQDTTRTIVLVVSTTCPSCNSSLDFYRSLFRDCVAVSGCRDRVVTLEPADAVRAWLESKKVDARNVTTVTRAMLPGVHTTPTLALVDSRGVITDLAVGKLNQAVERQFLARVEGQPNASMVSTERQPAVIAAGWASVTPGRKGTVHVVDIRERRECVGPSQVVSCMPLQELAVRAPIELQRESTIVVDCSHISYATCRRGADRLFADGFLHVSVAVVPDDAAIPRER